MATYLRQKVKKSTSSSSTRYASELQEHGRKPIPGTAAEDDCSAADRARFLQNPAILDTLDSVHRSLLFNNLKFDTDEHTDGLDSTYTISKEGVRKPSASYSRVPFAAPTTHVDEHDNKVNIAEASPDDRSSGTEVVLHEEEPQYERGGDCIAAANSYESLSLDDELAALFGRDWNNNLSGKAVASKVKMMVQQYERGKGDPVRTSAEHQTAVVLRHPDVSSIGEAETSDFESASVTSGGSSVSGGDGGRRSVRTSSAFSEGSRDVASIERFELGAVNQPQRQQQEELAAGHNTMITININYRCDTNNPPKTSKATCGEEVGVGAKNVDIVVSAPPGQAAREGGSRKSLRSDNAIEGRTVERYAPAAVEGDMEEQELMDLEKEDTEVTDGSVTSDFDAKGVELLPKDDAGTGSKMDHLAKERRRSSLTNNHCRPCYTPEDEEYHDCDDLHESTLSFYEQASSQPVTPQGQKQRSSPVECADALDGEQPMIRIVQELSEDHAEVTSTITLSKEQVREMQKANSARRSGESVEELKRHSPREEKSSVHEKRRKSSTSSSNGAGTATTTTKKRHDRSNLQRQQRIMDDNFCNEILDSTIHFDRLLGNARSQRHQAFEQEKTAAISSSAPPAAEECFSDSVVGELVSSPADESFDSVMSVGKLEGKPRYSGKTVGRLMMKRLKKLHGGGRDVPPKTINTSDASASSSLQTSGPKKPPRTFAANSPKRASGALPTPSCPTAKEVEGSDPSDCEIGWKLDSKPRTHQVGWKVPAASGKSEAIPAQIYSMLNYSEDESRRKLIKTGNSKPAPQQQSTTSRGGTGTAKYWPDGEPVGPKLAIDTVDGVKTPSRRHSTSTDFEKFVRESNVKSTPHRKSDAGSRAGDTRRRIELFLSEERQQQLQQGPERKLPGADRRRRTTGGIFERRRQQQENFLDDARRTNHEPRRRKKVSKVPSLVAGGSKHACCSAAANAAATASLTRGNGSACSGGGKIEKRRTFRKAALLKRTRILFEASKKKIWAIKKFETPKKLNIVSSGGGGGGSTTASPSDRDPNINRNSSVKKKNSLHHKHLGYTPVHLRCKTCGSGQTEANNREQGGEEDVVVPVKSRASAQQAAPAPRGLSSNSSEDENKENRFVKKEGRRRSGEEVNRKSARSLNFASVPQEKRLTSSPVDRDDREASPRKTGKQLTEPKFLKTLRNLKISPKRIFRFASHSSEAALNNPSLDGESHGQGEFQSFDDLNLDSVANMGDFLSNIRKKIDGESCQQASAYRGQVAAVDVHDGAADQEDDDPIYQEISPKGNKMILNEFISSDTNKRYLMVNNNPNILYAMVEKGKSAGRLVRARSLTNVQGTASAADPTVSTTPVSKPLNNTIKSQMKPSNRRVTMSPHMERFDAVDMEESDCLYQTALTTNSTNVREGDSGLYRSALANSTSSARDSIGRRVPGRSLNATGSTSASSTRRSLFARHVPADRDRSVVGQRQQHQQQSATDESDISILQEEESGHNDEVSLESRPDSVPIVREPLIVRERVEDRLSSVVRRESERFQQKPTGATAGRRKEEEEDVLLAFEKDIIVEEEMGGKNGKDGKGGNLILLKAHKSVQVMVEGGNGAAAAPLGCFDTDGEIESLRKYNDREIEELVHSLHDNVTLSDVGTLDTETTASSSMGGNENDHIGYDTVDLAPRPLRTLQKPASKNQTIDTVDVSELISHAPDDSLSSASNLSPITGSLTSTKMSTTSGTAVMRNLKDKLRSSFRKSKTFIKNERQRLANYLEERTASKSSSASSSAANSPRRRPVEQTHHFNTIGHTQSVQQSAARRRLECSEQEESDDMYRSFTEGSGSIVTAGSSMTELSSQHMSELMQQIIRQGDARKQLKQALGICRSTREFECSPELIEAERLLLVATQKETAVRNELNKIDYQAHGMTLAEGKRVGTVTLSNFEFPLKEAAVRDALFNYFYVVVCTYKHEVKATVAKERYADGRVYLRDCAIQFANLDANYEIKVEVFVLQLRKNVKNYSFESRYHLEKDSKRPLSCPSPSKKLREAGRLLSFRSSSPKTFDFDNEFSRFKSQGFLTLTSFTLLTANGAAEGDDAPEEEKHFDATYATARTSHNTHLSTMLEGGDEELLAEGHSYYSTTGHFQPVVCRRGDDQSALFIAEEFKYLTLDSMAYTSNMVGTIGMSVRSEVRFDGSDMAGFLDVGEKVEGSDESITWSRRWCKLNGFMLEFWNYPQECQEKQPVLYIDLVKCINERIQLADRTICSRPRTLKVEIFASRVAAGAGASCNSSGIGSFRSTTGRTTSPSCSAGDQDRDGLLRPLSPGEQQRSGGGGTTQSHNNVICYLLAADTQSDLKSWLGELNRVVKFLKEWKF
uniref:PH domain-containing protein n=2 Tax=Anopheles gambiae TaxID=7165 RepID=A0A1S4GR34_ANOGA